MNRQNALNVDMHTRYVNTALERMGCKLVNIRQNIIKFVDGNGRTHDIGIRQFTQGNVQAALAATPQKEGGDNP
jgi:hypothetical protein